MAFTTQEGTGGAPWTFQGTPLDDSVAVITGNNFVSSDFSFIADGLEGNDIVNFNGFRSVTIKGGQGDDIVTNNVAVSSALFANTLISDSFINGNDGNDVIGNSQYGIEATLSTISGGQADDKIYVASLQSTKVNGNRGADKIYVGEASFSLAGTSTVPIFGDVGLNLNPSFSLSNFNNASIFGGQGDDLIEVVSINRDFNNSQIAGQDGNDVIAVQIGLADFAPLVALAEAALGEDDPVLAAELAAFVSPFTVLTEPDFEDSVISGGLGDDIIDASGLLVFDEIDEVSTADLFIVGNEGDDSAFGGLGDDIIEGNDGDDWLAGYGERDEIFGGKGDDVIIGAFYDGELNVGFVGDGAGDILSGGTGSNRFFVPGSKAADVQAGPLTNPLGSTDNILVIDRPDALKELGTISNGDLIAVRKGADVIIDWNSGAGNNVLDTGLGNNLRVPELNPAALMSLTAKYNSTAEGFKFGFNYAVRGNYVERFDETGEFVVNEFGSDIAVWTNYNSEQFFTAEAMAIPGGQEFASTVNNFTVLKDVPTTTVLTANEFVAV